MTEAPVKRVVEVPASVGREGSFDERALGEVDVRQASRVWSLTGDAGQRYRTFEQDSASVQP